MVIFHWYWTSKFNYSENNKHHVLSHIISKLHVLQHLKFIVFNLFISKKNWKQKKTEKKLFHHLHLECMIPCTISWSSFKSVYQIRSRDKIYKSTWYCPYAENVALSSKQMHKKLICLLLNKSLVSQRCKGSDRSCHLTPFKVLRSECIM